MHSYIVFDVWWSIYIFYGFRVETAPSDAREKFCYPLPPALASIMNVIAAELTKSSSRWGSLWGVGEVVILVWGWAGFSFIHLLAPVYNALKAYVHYTHTHSLWNNSQSPHSTHQCLAAPGHPFDTQQPHDAFLLHWTQLCLCQTPPPPSTFPQNKK